MTALAARLGYGGCAALTMAMGLASRGDWPMPDWFATWGGDTLWAALIYWLIRALAPARPIRHAAAGAALFASAIEFSQLYHAPWIDALRATTLGALVLGHGFLSSDLACYAVGIAIAAVLDRSVRSRRAPAPPAGAR